MRPISPGLGGDEVTFAENQLEYKPIVATRVPDAGKPDAFLMRYTFTAEERQRIAAGEDLALWMIGGVIPHWLEPLNDVVKRMDDAGPPT